MASGLNFLKMSDKNIPVYQFEEFFGNESEVYLFPFDSSEDLILAHSNKISIPHRHDHYCCFFLEEGTIDFNIDFHPVQVNQNSLLVSYPGQVHQFISCREYKGWALSFSAGLVDDNARMLIEKSFENVALLTLKSEEIDWFKKLFDLIYTVLNIDNKAPFNAQLRRSLLDSFVYQACYLYQLQQEARTEKHTSRNVDIAKRFCTLLQKNFKVMKKPSEYAEKMNLSVSYLNDTVKSVTGFSLTYLIQQEIFGEAQRLLFYSEMSVKEISYNLGFEDDKYFIRLFGKTIGTSPASFRKNRVNRSFLIV